MRRPHTLADASCSGATTADMTAPQDVTPGPANPPQFNALTADTQIVTLQIGGNDISFTSILENCATANPFAHPCRDKYVVNVVDTLADRIAATALKAAAACGDPCALAERARVRRRLRSDPARDRRRISPQVPIGLATSYLRGVEKNLHRCSPSRPPPTARASSTTTPPASAGTRPGHHQRAGSSHWSQQTRCASTPTRAARRGSRRSSQARSRAEAPAPHREPFAATYVSWLPRGSPLTFQPSRLKERMPLGGGVRPSAFLCAPVASAFSAARSSRRPPRGRRRRASRRR